MMCILDTQVKLDQMNHGNETDNVETDVDEMGKVSRSMVLGSTYLLVVRPLWMIQLVQHRSHYLHLNSGVRGDRLGQWSSMSRAGW